MSSAAPLPDRPSGRKELIMETPALRTLTFRRGDTIFQEGELGTEAYRIRAGYVQIWRMEDGQKVNLAVRSEGDLIGEMALFDNCQRSASVTAGAPVEVEVITKEDLQNILKNAPEILTALLHQIMDSLRSANDLISMYAARPKQD
jgi:CRP-like cAMP-binding protein